MKNAVLALLRRGAVAESFHYGDLAVVDKEGKLLYSYGDPSLFTYIRSAAKPFQVLPLLKRNLHRVYDFTQEELAVMTASHSGEARHVKRVRSILQKIHLSEEFLRCGIHPPLHKKSRKELHSTGISPSEVHCNCSGKHSGMLALCKFMGWSFHDYLDENHPLQQEILEEVSSITSYPKERIEIGLDGCSAPTYALPLTHMAWGYAKLAAEEEETLSTLSSIMRNHPWYVGGTRRFETLLMEIKGDSILAKTGAEGVFCIALLDRELGIALKVRDGSSRVIPPVILSILCELEVLSRDDLEDLEDFEKPLIYNHGKMVVGEIEASVQLQREE